MLPTKQFQNVKFFLRNSARDFSFVEGMLILSHWEMLFFAQTKGASYDTSETYNSISMVEQKKDQKTFFLEIIFKNMKHWVLSFPTSEAFDDFVQTFSGFRTFKDGELEGNIPAFGMTFPYDVEENGWLVYSARRDLERILGQAAPEIRARWVISKKNKNYQVCDSYPSIVALPASFNEDGLKNAADYRDLSRFPILSWVHPEKGSCITRCSQPLPGRLANIRNTDDEKLIEAIFKTNSPKMRLQDNVILDARPFTNAMANRYKGAGYEQTEFYQECKIEFMGIENIHAMRLSLDKLQRACRTLGQAENVGDWLDKIEATGWYNHIQGCLRAASRVATLIHKGHTVVIHCSHGWDRTAQMSALAQLMLDPHYRTLIGFERLIEKEWLAYGHKVQDRGGHVTSLEQKERDDEESPIFLQFLDCVYQYLVQYPTQFGFNQDFLLAIIDGFYQCKYGTFLCNSEMERRKLKIKDHTRSFWSYTNHSSNIGKFLNPLYDHRNVIPFLTPSHSANKIVLWKNLYERNEVLLSPTAETIAGQRLVELCAYGLQKKKVSALKEEIDLLDKVLAQKHALLLKLQQQNALSGSTPLNSNGPTTASSSTSTSTATSTSTSTASTTNSDGLATCPQCLEGKCVYHADVAVVFRKAKGGDARDKQSQNRIKSNNAEKNGKKLVDSKRHLLEGWELLESANIRDEEKSADNVVLESERAEVSFSEPS